MAVTRNLTVGNETKVMLKLALPMIAGNLFQQLYNVTDTIIVGRFIGSNALAAVGSSFSVMVLLNSIILGFCMGSSTVFSILYGAKEIDKLKNSFFISSCLIGLLSLVINFLALFYIDDILFLLRIPQEVLAASALIILLAKPLVSVFVDANETEILQIGTQYLFIVAGFYCLIGYLFMFYGLFRGLGRPGVSIILTVVSLGTRVILAYTLSSLPSIGLIGIWWAIPIGWALADIVGYFIMKRNC